MFSQVCVRPHPGMGGGGAYLRTYLGQGSIRSTCYTAGGMSFAVTQEDCFVVLRSAQGSFTRNVNVTIFVSGTFDLFDVMCNVH